MGFAKLDNRIIDSTIWDEDPETRIVFVTALCMARPITLGESAEVLDPATDQPTGLQVPAGAYGFIDASASGIIHRARVGRDAGIQSLLKLASPDVLSTSKALDGRRLLHISGGFILVNFAFYREHDHSTPRVRAYRERQRNAKTAPGNADVTRSNTSEAEYRIQTTEAERTTPRSKAKQGTTQSVVPIRSTSSMKGKRHRPENHIHASAPRSSNEPMPPEIYAQAVRLFNEYGFEWRVQKKRDAAGLRANWALTSGTLEQRWRQFEIAALDSFNLATKACSVLALMQKVLRHADHPGLAAS